MKYLLTISIDEYIASSVTNQIASFTIVYTSKFVLIRDILTLKLSV